MINPIDANFMAGEETKEARARVAQELESLPQRVKPQPPKFEVVTVVTKNVAETGEAER